MSKMQSRKYNLSFWQPYKVSQRSLSARVIIADPLSVRLLTLSSYVEMLTRQQHCLVNGLHALYKQLEVCHGWKRPPPKDLVDGEPLTHYILERLGILGESDHQEVPALLTENEDPSNESASRISTTLSFPVDSEFSNFAPTWAYEQDEIKQTGQNPTPPSEDFSCSPSWGQRPGEGNLHMQLLPPLLEHGTTAQLGQQHDYFSLRMGQMLDASSEYQFVADYNGMPKQMMFSQVELE